MLMLLIKGFMALFLKMSFIISQWHNTKYSLVTITLCSPKHNFLIVLIQIHFKVSSQLPRVIRWGHWERSLFSQANCCLFLKNTYFLTLWRFKKWNYSHTWTLLQNNETSNTYFKESSSNIAHKHIYSLTPFRHWTKSFWMLI